MIIPMATLGSPVCCFMASLITADGEVTDEGTREFLRAKAKGDASPLLDGIAHLKRYLQLPFKPGRKP